MSPINCEDLHRIFKKLDRNGDGLVSVDELKWLLERTGVQISVDELEILVGKASLDLMDFWVLYDILIKCNNAGNEDEGGGGKEDENKKLESDLVKAFKVFDTNDDGVISCDELENALSRLGLWEEDGGRSCRSMIEFYDTNNDGVLDFEEFKNMLLVTES